MTQATKAGNRVLLLGTRAIGSLRRRPRPIGSTAASQCRVQNKRQVRQQRANPHECKHLDANDGIDVELVLRRQGNLGRDAEHSGDDGGNGEQDAGYQGKEGDEGGEETGADDEGRGAHEDKVENGAGHEEAVHDLRADAEEGEDGGYLRGEGDLGAGEELADENVDGVEPAELLGF